MRALFFYIFIGIGILASGQNIEQELAQISNFYTSKNYSYKLSYYYYNQANSTKADKVLSGEVHAKESQYFYKIGKYEVLRNKKYHIVLNGDAKQMIIDTAVGEQIDPNMEQGTPADLQSVLDSLERSQKGTIISYTYRNPKPGIAYMVYKTDTSLKYFHTIEVYFYENRQGRKPNAIRNKLVMRFTEFNNVGTSELEMLSENKYFSVINGQTKINKQYNTYHIINQLKHEKSN